MKKCSKCKEEKLAKDFYKNKRSKDGLYSCCKSCHKSHVTTWVKNNPDKHGEYVNAWEKKNEDKVRTYAKEYYYSHLEQCRAYNKKRDPDKERERKRKYYEAKKVKNKEQIMQDLINRTKLLV